MLGYIMYNQIKQILQQNRIPNENFIFTNEFGQIILNDNEDYDEYVIGDDKGQSYIWFLYQGKERTFNIINQLNFNGITICPLMETSNE